jgi:two-component system, OmpR family, response regulator ChvI
MNPLADNAYRYDDFPVASNSAVYHSWNISTTEEISFSGHRQHCCICFIDMMNSTGITAGLTQAEISKYYAIFLNAMAKIAKNFGARIIKSAGDCLIYYFPRTSDRANQLPFKDVLECSITMISAHRAINSKLQEGNLPSLDYRISADYGEVLFAKSTSSQTDDIFGPTVNICAKINSKAPPNGMVIGKDLFEIVKTFDDYQFAEKEGYLIGLKQKYSVYSVLSKQKRNILDPFKRTSELNVHRMPSLINNALDMKLSRRHQHKNAASIVLIDDEPDMLFTFKSFLAEERYNIEEFTDSMQALQYFEKMDPPYSDLVITDIKMPGLNGLELYQRLKAINIDIKVLFVTAVDAAEMLVNVLPGVKPSDIIRKPIDKERFIEMVKSNLA